MFTEKQILAEFAYSGDLELDAMLTVVNQVSECCVIILFPAPCNVYNFSVSCNALSLNMFYGRSTDRW
jgi:hypothetical protein